jgi:two-component system, LytTR family, sensor kinase
VASRAAECARRGRRGISSRPLKTLARRWFVTALSLTAAAVLFTGQVSFEYMYLGRRISWAQALAVSLSDWEVWTLLAPAVLALAARVPVSRARLPRALAVHVPASLALSAIKLIAETWIVRAILGGGRLAGGINKLYLAVLTYWAIVAAAQYADQRRLVRERELRASQLETELARAQVDALRMQLHPHFLFNTLNTIAGLMREDVEAADAMLTQLAELLRLTLQHENRQRAPLSEEIEWIRAYLAIQRTRYGPRLRIDIDVPAECGHALVPTLILQPLVENAIRHGFAETPGPGLVAIRARRHDGRLWIDVDDEGPGVAEPLREGYGLRNTRSRLRALYGDGASLDVRTRDEGSGARSRIDVAFDASATS